MPAPKRRPSETTVLIVDDDADLKPDAIVLDLAMPRVDGWTVLKHLRESSWTNQIPIVVVSAVHDVRDEAMRTGADAYLAKPCAPDIVWMQINALLRMRHQRTSLAFS